MRYYAVSKTSEDKDVGEELLKAGLARVHGRSAAAPEGQKAEAQDARLEQLKADARAGKAGLWSKVK